MGATRAKIRFKKLDGMNRALPVCFTILALSTATARTAEDDAALGARVFRACTACHSLETDRNMTGPSLAGVWNRRAGDLKSFSRYSDAMKLSGITWDEQSLGKGAGIVTFARPFYLDYLRAKIAEQTGI
jgi:cytochrome c551/c552